MAARFQIKRGDGHSEDRDLQPGIYTVGRDAGDIVLNDPNVSARHAQITVKHNQAIIADLGSRNGTFDASRNRLQGEHSMRPDEPVSLGKSEIILRSFGHAAGGTLIAGRVEFPPSPAQRGVDLDPQQPSPNVAMGLGREAPPTAAQRARIADIDISSAARALSVLRWSDYLLVVVCGLTVPASLVSAFNAPASDAWIPLLLATLFGLAAYTGWRHVGVIDPRVWRSLILVFSLLGVFGAVMLLAGLAMAVENGWQMLGDIETMLGLMSGGYVAGIAIPGFICVVLLRRARIPAVGKTLRTLLDNLASRSGRAARDVTHLPRPQVLRGLAYALGGVVLLVVIVLMPTTTDEGKPSVFLRASAQINILACFLIVRARRYFQVSADALLAVDKRSPILFLRSFTDDERQQYGNSQRAVLDFSLEARLANHFYRFGPFIAVGSPKDAVPQPGAARILLGDDEWQARVLRWMKDANLIIMYCGKTQWVNWELRQVVESGRATRLILMFPEIKGWRSARRKEDVVARVAQIREVFKDTPWSEELLAFDDFVGLRAMLFRADGSMLMVRSRSRSRDAYHLSALIAHQEMLEPSATARTFLRPAAKPVEGPITPLRVLAAAAALALFLTIILRGSERGDDRAPPQTASFAASVSEAPQKRVAATLRPQPHEIRIIDAPESIEVGGRQRLKIEVLDSRGNRLSSALPRWKSSNVEIARVSSDGMVEALHPGHVNVEATLDSLDASTSITVRGPPAQPVTIYVTWELGSEQHRAALMLERTSGTAVVTCSAGTIMQELSFVEYANGTAAFIGSNVRPVPGTSLTAPYTPDVFRMVRNSEGHLAFTVACDAAANVCAPLHVLDAP